MVDGVGGHHDVADVDGRVKRPGDAGVQQRAHAKAVDQHLRARGGVHHAHAALHQHDGGGADDAHVELHAGDARDLHGADLSHVLAYKLDFDIHGADDADAVNRLVHASFLCLAG